MADFDTNLIKPVQSLQNIANVGPAKRRKERSRQRQLNDKSNEQDESAQDRETEPEKGAEKTNDPDSGGIDYCA